MFPSTGYFPTSYFDGAYFPPVSGGAGILASSSSLRAVSRADDPYVVFATNTDHLLEFVGWLNPYKGNVVRPAAGHSIPIVGLDMVVSETLSKGVLVKNMSGAATEADPSIDTIYGILAEPTISGASLGPQSNKVLVIRVAQTNVETGRTTKTRFACKDIVGTAPTNLHIDGNYNLSNVGGETGIDILGGTGTHVVVKRIDTVRGEFIVEFLDAKIQS